MITDEQIKQALESAGVEFQYFIHARTNKQVCTTAGSIDFNKIASGIRELIALAKQEPAQAVPLDDDYVEYQVWRSTDSCMECWSWDECNKEDYDKAHPTARRIIKVISHDV